MRQIKVCHIANTDKVVKFLLLPQLKFLIKENYDVYTVCSSGKWTEYIEQEGVKVKNIKIRRKISPIEDLVSFFRLFFYFKKEKFDIVHTHTPKPSLLGQSAAKLAGVPIVIDTIHGLYFHKNSPPLKRKFFVFIQKLATSCSTLIFSQNKEDIETLVKEKIAELKKIRYLGNGIDIEKFDAKKFSPEFIGHKKEELNIPADFKVVGIVARLVEEKGYLDLFNALKTVLKVFPKTVLLAIGPEEPEKKDAVNPKIVEDYNIESNVVFLGERSDVEEIYPLMDVFVLPSYREGFPRSILEAMAEKLPIVATDIRGCREEIENNKNGILVPVKNSEKLAEAIIYLFNDSKKAKMFGENARERVEKYFSEDIVFDKIKKEYHKLIKERL
jgi:glycosyltransferase involved in cell wall biosynthesis